MEASGPHQVTGAVLRVLGDGGASAELTQASATLCAEPFAGSMEM